MPLFPVLRRFVALFCASWALTGFGQSVVINEIHYKPPDNTKPIEFIELHNPGAATVDLAGWRLEDGVLFNFPAGKSIPAGGYFVVAQNAAAFQAQFGFAPGGIFTGGLNSVGERLQLRNAAGTLVDEVNYGVGFPWPTAAKGGGSSMELINPALDNDLAGSWRSSGTSSAIVTLIPSGDNQWHYRKGTSEASNPITAWRTFSFVEDGTWIANATAPIGYGDIDGGGSEEMATLLPDMVNNYRSIFMRRTFTVAPGQVPNFARVAVALRRRLHRMAEWRGDHPARAGR
jgi:hypothetical protein